MGMVLRIISPPFFFVGKKHKQMRKTHLREREGGRWSHDRGRVGGSTGVDGDLIDAFPLHTEEELIPREREWDVVHLKQEPYP